VLRSTGSVGLALIYWVIGALIGWAGLAYYLELGSYFPNRAGADVVYLEQAWKRPRYLFPAAFAASVMYYFLYNDSNDVNSGLDYNSLVLELQLHR
jgi:hypothetical protein